MPSRRMKGEGSYTTLPSGNIRLLFYVDGHRYSVTASSVQAANAAKQGKLRELSFGVDVNAKVTVKQWYELWQEKRRRSGLAEGSLKLSEYALRDIVTNIGHIKMTAIREQHLSKYLNSDIAASTNAQRLINIKTMFNAAVKAGIIPVSPMRNITTSKSTYAREIPTTIIEDTMTVLAGLRGKPQEGICQLMWRTGLRIGEAAGLKWTDIKMEENSCTIAVSRSYGYNGLGKTKTRSSMRTIVGDAAVKEVLEMQAQYNTIRGKDQSEWVFPGKYTLRPIHTTGVRQALQAVSAGYCPHMLRHAHATFLLSRGMQLYYVSRRLGHASISITAQIYAHVIPDDNERLFEVMKDA